MTTINDALKNFGRTIGLLGSETGVSETTALKFYSSLTALKANTNNQNKAIQEASLGIAISDFAMNGGDAASAISAALNQDEAIKPFELIIDEPAYFLTRRECQLGRLSYLVLLFVVSLASTTVLLGNSVALAQRVNPPTVEAYSSDFDHPTITNFTLVCKEIRTELHVLTSYIDWDATEGKNEGSYIHLKMLWPSLASTPVRFGTFNEKQNDDEAQLLHSGEAFMIELSQGTVARISDNIKRHISDDWIPLTAIEPIPGFEQYVSKMEETSVVKKSFLGTRILVPLDKDYADKVYFECPVNSPFSPAGLYCTGHNYLGHYVYGEYHFSLANIQDWRKIDATVRQLFESMMNSKQ
jgi:hypothetical protein